MAKKFSPKVVTGNDLLEGDVVYLNVDRQWVRTLEDAYLVEVEADTAEWLTAGESQPNDVVGVYLMDADAGADGPVPTHFRETFRKTGPSNYAHGKQVDLPAATAHAA
ncbi:MAG: DUF2849 domain-containing protein [Planktomarina sp.]